MRSTTIFFLAALALLAAPLGVCVAAEPQTAKPAAAKPSSPAVQTTTATHPGQNESWPAHIWRSIDSPYGGTMFDPPASMIQSLDGVVEQPLMISDGFTEFSNTAPIPMAPASETVGIMSTQPSSTMPASQPTTRPESKNEFFFAPIPSHNAGQGWGIAGMAGYIFEVDPNDKISPPSTIALAGYISEKESWVAGLAGRFFLDEDRYRIVAAQMNGEINYDYFGIGTGAGSSGVYVALKQSMNGGILEAMRQISPSFYLGPRYTGAVLNVDVSGTGVTLPADQLNSTMSALGMHFQWDTRDSQFYPTKGASVDFRADFHDPGIGDSFTYQHYSASYVQFLSLDDKQVIGWRVAGQASTGDVPFYGLSMLGRGPDLRGYAAGQYQDNLLFAAQAEYRLMITKRFGAVGFAGLGAVGSSAGDLFRGPALPSYGGGLRYMLAPKNHMNIRADIAFGKDGEPIFYLAVGESF